LLTHRLLRRWSKKTRAIFERELICRLSSIPGMAVYAASKPYVNSFSEALRAELGGTA